MDRRFEADLGRVVTKVVTREATDRLDRVQEHGRLPCIDTPSECARTGIPECGSKTVGDFCQRTFISGYMSVSISDHDSQDDPEVT